jgi:DNA-binding transcriptional LysR family regulator
MGSSFPERAGAVPPDVADLRLVVAVARHGSVGSAARELLISQPSASQRLSALERRCGVRLFERDTTGARPTAAGNEMVENARHILAHLDQVFERSRAAADSETISVGTLASLAVLIFPALQVALPHLRTSQVTDHGTRLVDWVAEGSLDAAFVAIAQQMELPRGVTRRAVGVDPLALLVPATCDVRSANRRHLAGRVVITYTVDNAGEELDRRLVAVGATPNRAATAGTAVRMGRMLGHPVVLPRSLLRGHLGDGEREFALRYGGPRLFLVTRVPVAPYWKGALPVVRRELGLQPASTRSAPPDAPDVPRPRGS